MLALLEDEQENVMRAAQKAGVCRHDGGRREAGNIDKKGQAIHPQIIMGKSTGRTTRLIEACCEYSNSYIDRTTSSYVVVEKCHSKCGGRKVLNPSCPQAG